MIIMEKWESKCALIILNYNSAHLTIGNAERLRSFSKEIEIVIVDNCSTDNSFQLIEKALGGSGHTWLIKNDVNSGYAAGNNVGFRFIVDQLQDVEYVAIINPDIVIEELETLKELCMLLNKHENLALITTQTIYNGRIRQPNDFGWRHLSKRYMVLGGTILGKILRPSVRYKDLSVDEDKLAYIDIAQGCFFMAKLNAMKEIDFFDERTFLYGEEAILAKKLQKAGYKEAVLMNRYVYHNHTEKDKKLRNPEKKLFDMSCYYSSRKYYIKNYSETSRGFKIFASLFLNLDYTIKKAITYVR